MTLKTALQFRREAQEPWPQLEGVRHHYVTVAGAEIHYVEAGSRIDSYFPFDQATSAACRQLAMDGG